MAFTIFFFFFEKVEKLELSPQNFRYDVLHLLYSDTGCTRDARSSVIGDQRPPPLSNSQI